LGLRICGLTPSAGDCPDQQQQEEGGYKGLQRESKEVIGRPDEQDRDDDNSEQYQEDGDGILFQAGHLYQLRYKVQGAGYRVQGTGYDGQR
jgi:hypothetical protein